MLLGMGRAQLDSPRTGVSMIVWQDKLCEEEMEIIFSARCL